MKELPINIVYRQLKEIESLGNYFVVNVEGSKLKSFSVTTYSNSHNGEYTEQSGLNFKWEYSVLHLHPERGHEYIASIWLSDAAILDNSFDVKGECLLAVKDATHGYKEYVDNWLSDNLDE